MEDSYSLTFNVEQDGHSEETAKEILHYVDRLISDFDASGGLFVKEEGEYSIKNLVKNKPGADQDVLKSIEKTDKILDELNVSDIAGLSDLIVEYLQGNDQKYDEAHERIDEIKDVFDRAVKEYEENVAKQVEETTSDNVGYGLHYLENMQDHIYHIEKNL